MTNKKAEIKEQVKVIIKNGVLPAMVVSVVTLPVAIIGAVTIGSLLNNKRQKETIEVEE